MTLAVRFWIIISIVAATPALTPALGLLAARTGRENTFVSLVAFY